MRNPVKKLQPDWTRIRRFAVHRIERLFASKVFREQLFQLDGSKYPNMRINLQTNGVLLTPKSWRRMKAIHANISAVIVSIDAATQPTYEITRSFCSNVFGTLIIHATRTLCRCCLMHGCMILLRTPEIWVSISKWRNRILLYRVKSNFPHLHYLLELVVR